MNGFLGFLVFLGLFILGAMWSINTEIKNASIRISNALRGNDE